MVESGLGFSVGGEVGVFSGKNFMSLLDWEGGSMGVSVSWGSPVGDSWCGMDNRGDVVSGNSVNWSWSLWQVGG